MLPLGHIKERGGSMKLTIEIIKAQKLAHKAHTTFGLNMGGSRVDKWGYLISKCIPCKAEYITRNFCETCDDYIQQVKPNQAACPVCNS